MLGSQETSLRSLISTPSRKGVRMSHQNVVQACANARRRCGLFLTTISIALLGAFVPGAIAASPEAPGETFPASVSAGGAWADGEGVDEFTPVSISADGRYVAFQSAAGNLGEAGPTGVSEGFVKDLSSGVVSLVSRANGVGGQAAGEPGIAGLRLSADGRYAIFTSAATNLGTPLPGEAAGERHVYRRDLQTGETALVDRVSGVGGAIFSRGAEAASISADGRYVAFTARVENLEDPSGDHAETANTVGYVRGMQTGVTVAISRASGATGEIADEPTEGLSISADGRYVAFASRATNLVPGVDEGVWEQVYLRDLQTDATTLVSRNALGEPGDRGSSFPIVSGEDGCKVTFGSIAFNLLEPSPLEVSGDQVYVADHCASPATITLVSQDADEPIAPFAYTLAGTSGDGRDALFAAEFAGSPCCHLYMRDLGAGETTQLDRASGAAGAKADDEVEQFAISANGCRVAFASRATNLFGGGPPTGPGGEEPAEVYVRQLKPCVATEPDIEPEESKTDDSKPLQPPSPAAHAELKIASLNARELVLNLTGPGRVSIRVRRFVEHPRRRWPFLRTIATQAGAAGQLAVPLPSLGAGRYRLNVHLHGTPRGVVRLLTIER
jgi:hypothetical protein